MQPISDSAARVTELRDGWTLTLTPPGAFDHPPAETEWLPAIVPGTVAGALSALGHWSLENPAPLADQDVWYRCRLPGEGPARLVFEGLATIAEIYLDGVRIAAPDSMFVPITCVIDRRDGAELAIVFRSLSAELGRRTGKRARWRPTLIDDPRLRLVRTTLLGHMPGWCPPVDIIGPYRAVRLIEDHAPRLRDVACSVGYRDGIGQIALSFADDGSDAAAVLSVAGFETVLERGDGRVAGVLECPGVAPWWPAGYGAQALHDVALTIGERRIDLGRTGFRSVELDTGPDGRGFALVVNGVRIFCRGAVWTPADIVMLDGSRAAVEPLLRLAAEAGFTMLRISGTMLYEDRAFHDLCDEFGILVWQDFMFANCDYPADDGFAANVAAEADALLGRLALSPSLAVLCGGSEVAQQAAMMGLPPERWTSRIFAETLPEMAARLRPDIPYVPSSPFGGDLPFVADAGVTHYFGVGAYRRPLEDARRADVRFAAECLAFANVPDKATLDEALPAAPVHHPRWKAAVPRDLSASWDFEDIREHYTPVLYGEDPERLRFEESERHLDLARATSADLVSATFAEWRRPASNTAGGLVWLYRDLVPGAGWGVVDALGRPKSIWHAMKRSFAPLALFLTDEGVNGLACHIVNDGQESVTGTLSLACLRDGRLPVARGERVLTIPPYGGLTLTASDLLGAFFDTTYAYRFGPAGHDVSLLSLTNMDGKMLAEATHWLPGRRARRHQLGLTAAVEQDGDGWSLALRTDRMAAHVIIEDTAYRPAESGFDLPPGSVRYVRLLPLRACETAAPQGEVRAINGFDTARYQA